MFQNIYYRNIDSYFNAVLNNYGMVFKLQKLNFLDLIKITKLNVCNSTITNSTIVRYVCY